MVTWQQIVIPLLLGVIGAVLPKIVEGVVNRRRTDAEARYEDAKAGEARNSGAAKLLGATSNFAQQLMDRIDDLERATAAQAKVIQRLDDEVVILKAQDVERLTMIAAQNVIIGKLRQRIDRLFEWIRERGLEPPTMEELEGD